MLHYCRAEALCCLPSIQILKRSEIYTANINMADKEEKQLFVVDNLLIFFIKT